jgi:hypothetical protein
VDKMVCEPCIHHFTPLDFKILTAESLFTQYDEFLKMAHLIDDLENLLCEAVNTYGVQWAEKPLWRTWSLEQFGRFLMRNIRSYVKACPDSVSSLLYIIHTSYPVRKKHTSDNPSFTSTPIRPRVSHLRTPTTPDSSNFGVKLRDISCRARAMGRTQQRRRERRGQWVVW